MKRVGRCLFMWLLVFALPVQGFAASTMLFCGAGHHGMVQAANGGLHHSSHTHRGAQDVAEGSESHVHDPEAKADSSHGPSAFSPLSAKHAKVVGKCNVCAACCSFAVLPTAVIAFTAQAPNRALPVVELTTNAGFFTDGPDRPPRSPLA